MSSTKKAYFAAGCFWHVEDTFMKAPGVIKTTVGYMGGHVPNPTYKMVCSDDTGYAETVEVEFDPTKTNYQNLLDIFWESHDPTQLNRQGLDVGTQYRSAIFYVNEAQKKLAEDSKRVMDASGRFTENVVTEVVPATEFYTAEDYHQKYYQKMGLA